MPVLCPDLAPNLAEELHETNCRLSFWLDSLISSPPSEPYRRHPATPQQMQGLLSELMHAGEKLRAMPVESGSELTRELSAYRENVERLRTLLPSIHSTLLQERARLEQERTRVEAAREWARRSRQTL
jgi:hypothetical protein